MTSEELETIAKNIIKNNNLAVHPYGEWCERKEPK